MEYAELYLIIIVTFVLFWLYGTKNYNYWRDRRVFSKKPLLPFMGNIKFSYLFESNLYLIKSLYDLLSGQPYGGVYFFTKPVIIVREPDLIKKILITDFNYFVSRGFHSNVDKDPLSKNLIHVNGKDWKFIRPKLQTAFTYNKLKGMVSQMDSLAKAIVKEIEIGNVKGLNGNENFDAVNVSERYMIDVICSSVFGVKSNAIESNTGSEFYNIGREIFDGHHFLIHAFTGFLFPDIHRFFNMTVACRKVTDFFTAVSVEAVSLRKKIINSEINEKKNFLDTLIGMGDEQQKLENVAGLPSNCNVDQSSIKDHQDAIDETHTFECDNDFIAANVFMFFAAGFDSSAKICTYCLFELAYNEVIQEKARQEVNKVLNSCDGNLTLEAVQKMTYLEQVVAETNRKYPILSVIFRKCDKKYTMPDGGIIEPGTPIIIPSSAIHFDPEYYPEPDKFDPERFSKENKHNIHPCTHLPFGMGPRICVAWQSAIVEIKVVIARIISKYKITLHSSNDKYPLELNPKAFLLTPKSDVYLNFTKNNSSY